MKIDLANTFEHTNIKSVQREQFIRLTALHMTFFETRIGFFYLGNLFRAELDRMLGRFFFKLQEPLVTTGHTILDQDVLDGRRTDCYPFQFEHAAQLHTPQAGWWSKLTAGSRSTGIR